MITREILNTHPVSNLKKEFRKVKKGLDYSKLKKAELIELMLKPNMKVFFNHIKPYEKPARQPKATKPTPKATKPTPKATKPKTEPMPKALLDLPDISSRVKKTINVKPPKKETPKPKEDSKFDNNQVIFNKRVGNYTYKNKNCYLNIVVKTYEYDSTKTELKIESWNRSFRDNEKPCDINHSYYLLCNLINYIYKNNERFEGRKLNENDIISLVITNFDKETNKNIKEIIKLVKKMGFKSKEKNYIGQYRDYYNTPLGEFFIQSISSFLKICNNNSSKTPKPTPKKETPKPAPKAAPKKETPKPAPKNEELDKLGEFYKDLGKGFSSRRARDSFTKKYGKDLLSSAIDNQLGLDFFSTPPSCLLDNKEFLNIAEISNNVLEPTAGLGALVYTAIKAGIPRENITANDISKPFSDFIEKELKVKTTNKDFLKTDYKNNNYDLILLNPPFSSFGKKWFYYEFFYKAVQVLRQSKARGLKNIIFISPPLTKESRYKESKDRYIGEEDFKLSDKQKKELYKKYGFDDEILEDGEFDTVATQINYIGECRGFGGTNTKTNIYNVIV